MAREIRDGNHGNPARGDERQRHKRQLAAARRNAVLSAQRRFRFTVVGVLGLGISLPWLVAGDFFDWGKDDASQASAEPTSASFDDLTIRGRLRIVDSAGREIAVLGQEGPSGPVVLGLSASEDGAHGLRLATSTAGAAINLRAPNGDSAAGLIVTGNGPELEMRRGSERRVLDEAQPSYPTANGRPLPAVAAAPDAPVAGAAIDLGLADVQPIGGGFMVAKLSTTPRPDGLRVVGRIVNTTSVRHSGLRFRLSLGASEGEFEIPLISPGNSTSFRVDVADVRSDGPTRARIDYLGSTVSFATHSTTPDRGRVKR